jgi:DNA-binding PadR family transcriptional regulator
MEAKGLIEGREEAAPPGAMGPPRRKYKATGYGARVLHAHEIARAAMRPA